MVGSHCSLNILGGSNYCLPQSVGSLDLYLTLVVPVPAPGKRSFSKMVKGKIRSETVQIKIALYLYLCCPLSIKWHEALILNKS